MIHDQSKIRFTRAYRLADTSTAKGLPITDCYLPAIAEDLDWLASKLRKLLFRKQKPRLVVDGKFWLRNCLLPES